MKLTIGKTGETYEEITHTSDAKLKEGMTQIKFFKNEKYSKNTSTNFTNPFENDKGGAIQELKIEFMNKDYTPFLYSLNSLGMLTAYCQMRNSGMATLKRGTDTLFKLALSEFLPPPPIVFLPEKETNADAAAVKQEKTIIYPPTPMMQNYNSEKLVKRWGQGLRYHQNVLMEFFIDFTDYALPAVMNDSILRAQINGISFTASIKNKKV
ncbi:MAG: hypothetical protein SFU98_07290 [Leptospiraceae bacterium]|nr:hypothetical protein [Leptospiraceae bacterium]